MNTKPARFLFVGCHVLCLALCFGANAEAQSRFGVTAGLNWSSVGGDEPEDAHYGRALGVNTGLVGEFTLADDVVLSLQPMYARRGANVSFDVGEKEPRDSLELRLDYVDCLVMVKILADNGFSYFTSGLGIGFLTQATLEDIQAGEEDVESLFEDIDLSVAFGVGFMIPTKRTLVTIELRYQQSLMNMCSSDIDPSGDTFAPRLRSSGFQLLASALFPGRP